MTRLSVVIPVYNAETHLGECLDSLENQTFGTIEIVCVDDGSTDSSESILSTYAANDGRIRIVRQDNGGPSSARNAGIRAAAGDYIVFLDSDDLLEPNACQAILQATADEIDAVVFGWSCFGRRVNAWMTERGNTPDKLYPSFDPNLLFDEPTQPHLRIAVRRETLLGKNIFFDEALRIGEDAAFLFAVYPRMSGVRIMSDKLYRYRLPHEGSIMQEIAGDDVEECLHCLNAAISIFADWKRGGFIEAYGAQLVAWSIKYALYTMLRQETETRIQLSSALADLWRTYWTDAELRNMDLPRHVKLLMEHALDTDAPHLGKDLATYRVAEYGLAHLATTVLERFTLS